MIFNSEKTKQSLLLKTFQTGNLEQPGCSWPYFLLWGSWTCILKFDSSQTKKSKAQFRRLASAVPSLIAIRFGCSTAEARL